MQFARSPREQGDEADPMRSRPRLLLGVLLRDMPRYLWNFYGDEQAYLAIRNRSERLQASPDGSGYRCEWRWTSELHAPKILPSLGRQLMRRALDHHPVHHSGRVERPSPGKPQVSFVIGHRGLARMPHLLATLQSIAAQRDVAVECIVVEQETNSQLGPHMPAWVRLVHAPPPDSAMPYCRSWAFNVGARHARGAVLVLHDNDLLVPMDYAAEICRCIGQGYEVVNPKRFIFYLTQHHTEALFAAGAGVLDHAPEVIVQNTQGGGSVAITRDGFDGIGGMDESFVGWGGEDNEFWDRAQTLRTWPWGRMPLVHLWHAAQPGKRQAEPPTILHYRSLAKTEPLDRVERLRAASRGRVEGPSGWALSDPEGGER
jgi:hypothetical protein